MVRFVCSKCGSTLTHKSWPLHLAGWYCPRHGRVAAKLPVKTTRSSYRRYGL
jgi:hypothetical protein